MENSSTIQLDPLTDDDPFFLAYISELGTWDNLVKDRSFMEVMKDDDGDNGSRPVKKIKIDADAAGANSSSSSSSCSHGVASVPPVKAEHAEIVSRTPEDMELMTVPSQLFDALGELDTDFTRNVIDTYFDPNCTFVTTEVDEPIHGSDNLYEFLLKLADRMPDAVRKIRHCRVVADEAGNKAVKFKLFTTGTFIKDKCERDDLVPNLRASTLVSHLDGTCISKKEIARIKESFATSNGTESFSCLYRSACCWHLNEDGKVQRFDLHYQIMSMKPVK